MTTDASPLDTQTLTRVATDLTRHYGGIFSAETINRYVFESYTTLSRTAKVRTHLVTLTERFASDRLRALAIAQGDVAKTVPQILFVCVQNAGRSQIAAALLAHYGGEGVEVRSAGSLPGSEVPAVVIDVLAERGIDLSEAFPKPLTDDVVRAADYVITMGCGDACPIYPGKHYLDWELDDPAGETSEGVRDIVAQIDTRIRELWTEVQG